MRETPAVNVWLGGNGQWGTTGNWTDGVPTTDDVLLFGGPSNLGVNFPTTPNLQFAGIVVQSSYTGTLGFQAPITFGSYQQYGGYTFQHATSATVTSTGTFVWTGGGINTSTNPATYELKGVTTGQIGTDTTTLVSGSKFVLDKLGSVASWVTQHGVLNMLNGVGIDVMEDATLEQKRINQLGNQPAVNTDDKVLVKGQAYSDGGKLSSVKVDGGFLEVDKRGLEVTGKVPGTDWSVVVTSTGTGVVSIYNGATLKVAHGFLMDGGANGSLATEWETGANPSQFVTIEGKFRLDSGTVSLSSGMPETESTSYSALIVTENAELWGGTFKPHVCSATSALADFIKTEEKLDIKAAFTIEPYLLGSSPAPQTSEWTVLKSVKGFNDATNPTSGTGYTGRRSEEQTPLNWLMKSS